jgi:hypothetical protein
MSKADFYLDLVSDVENLVIGGETAASAMVLITLQDDDVDGSILKKWVMKRHGDEEALEAWGRQQAADAELKAVLSKEAASCTKKEGPYAKLPVGSSEPAVALVRQRVELKIGRDLTDHEAWMIEEVLNPWLSEVKLASKAGTKPLRTLSLGD